VSDSVEKRLLLVPACNRLTSGNCYSSFTPCSFAPLESDVISSLMDDWGVKFDEKALNMAPRQGKNSFIYNQVSHDLGRFESFLSELLKVIFVQHSHSGVSLSVIDENF
jgi:hypothetical protein